MPHGTRTFAADFDFLDHQLYLRTSDGATRALPLAPRTVADFYAEYLEALRSLGLEVRIRPVPVEVEVAIPFADDREHAAYDAEAVSRWWRIVGQADRVLKRFRGRFLGKASPVHFFWGSFDLAATRFSGRQRAGSSRRRAQLPRLRDDRCLLPRVQQRGLLARRRARGGSRPSTPTPIPSRRATPSGAVRPAGAGYRAEMREFVLPYEAVRRAADPDAALLDFCQSTYEIAADLGRWDRAALDR